jgi:putative glutathione S-transferase
MNLSQSEEKIRSHLDTKTGKFIRGASSFRNAVSSKPGAEFPPEKGRYHLYVSYACPWGIGISPTTQKTTES